MRPNMLFALLMFTFVPGMQAQGDGLAVARDLFFNHWEKDCTPEKLYEVLLSDSKTESNPVLLAYRGVARAAMAQCVASPFRKMTYFREGKSELESAIGKDPGNTEIRFIRFAMQTSIPSFLGYDNTIEDRSFIVLELQQGDVRQNTELASRILEFMLNHGSLTDLELRNLKSSK